MIILLLVILALFIIVNNGKPYVHNNETIPKIIHYMWISKENPYVNVPLPEKNYKYIKTWMKHNQDFEFVYWSGKDVIELVETVYPQYEQFYRGMDKVINKCDFARFLIIANYGGMYIDVDLYCKRNIYPLIEGKDSYFVCEPEIHGFDQGMSCLIGNAIFGACKNHDFVKGWIETMSNIEDFNKEDNFNSVLNTTGPINLTRYMNSNGSPPIYLGNTCNVLGMSAYKKFDSGCSENDIYMYTTWDDGSGWTTNPY